jgi:hypothetical protein
MQQRDSMHYKTTNLNQNFISSSQTHEHTLAYHTLEKTFLFIIAHFGGCNKNRFENHSQR